MAQEKKDQTSRDLTSSHTPLNTSNFKPETLNDEFKGFEFDEYGYIKDPSKVKDRATAEKLWRAGRITEAQIDESVAHAKLSKGLLNVDMKSADILYEKGLMTDEQYDDLKDYHNNPISWYVKDITKQILGGARDFTQETLETLYKLRNDYDYTIKVIKWLADVEDVPYPEQLKLPEVDKSESDVGKAIRGVSQFLTGFIPVFGLMNKVNQGRHIVNGMTAGAIVDFAGFDEHEKRLSDLVQSVPALQNPITEYLQSNKDDSMYEGKLKNALEGLGLGVVMDGVLLGFKAVKSNLWSKYAGDEVAVKNNVHEITGKTVDDILEEQKPNIKESSKESSVKSPEATKTVEDTNTKVIQNGDSEMGSQASKEVTNDLTDDRPITEKIVTSEDFNLMVEMGMKSDVLDTPVQPHEVTKRLAEEMGVDFKEIAKTSQDVQGLAQRVHSAMRVLDNYTEQLKVEIKEYLDEADNSIKPNIEKAMELFDKIKFHGGLQSTVKGISANIGRALNAHQIKVGEKFVDFKTLSRGDKDDVLRAMGGESNIHNSIKTFYEVLQSGSKRDINRYTKQLNDYKFSNFLHGTWLSGLLSGIGTQVVNLVGNTLTVTMGSLEHFLAVSGRSAESFFKGEGISSFRHFNEVNARVRGMGQGFIDAFRFFKFDENGAMKLDAGTFWQVLRDNEPILDPKMKIEDNVTHNMPTYFSKGRAEREAEYATMSKLEGNINRAIGIIGDIISLPLRFLSASDEAFKLISYKAEIMRSAVEEANNRGLKGDKARAFIRKYVEEPSTAVHQRALDVARENTFTRTIDTENPINGTLHPTRRLLSNAGVGVDKLASTITSMKHTPFIQHPMRYLVPFITTPLNIVKHVGRRSPLAIFSRRWQEDILAGGTRKAEAYAKLFGGMGTVIAISELYDRGLITGKPPKGNEEGFKMLGIPDYSIKIGDTWYDYSRMDPLGMTIGLVADVKTAFDMSEHDEQIRERIWSLVTMSVMNNMVNKTYMKNVSDTINMINDPVRYKPEDFGANLISTFLPYSSAITQYNNSQDPYYREAKTVEEYIRKKLSPQSLPPKLDVFGDPIKRTPKLLMAIENNEVTDDEVLREIYRVGANIGESNQYLEIEGERIDLDIREHNEFKKLIGATGVKDEIKELINSPLYQSIEDFEVKASLIKRLYSRAKEQAKYEFIESKPRYKDKVLTNYELKGDRIYDPELSEPANRKYHPIPALNNIRKEIESDK